MVVQAFNTSSFPPKLAETPILLIPKETNPVSVHYFRSICSCNVIYKILNKVLVNRIRPFLSDLMSPLQCNFILGRAATDNIVIAQEIMHIIRKSKRKVCNLVVKLDLAKAYYRADWSFLKQTLSNFGFLVSYINLIMYCVMRTNLSIMWNGTRLPGFNLRRGLWLGGPLLPYLFVLCMEKLALATKEKVQNHI